MARPRTPTSILEARGAFDKNPQRARPNEPEPVGELGDPPKHLTAPQAEAWYSIVSSAHERVFCQADRIAVEIAAVLLAEFRAGPVEMPAARLARLDSLLARFGMTPADRSKVTVPKPEKVNPFLALVGKA